VTGHEKELSEADRQLLSAMQQGFSPVLQPFQEIAERLGVTEEKVISDLRRLKANGIIRRLGAIIDSRKIGYTGTLCAMQVPAERIPEVADVINAFPEITHNYVREHDYNIWFTILAPSTARINQILKRIKEQTGITTVLNLSASRIFKIRVNFDLEGDR
jgi:DNA-binding Lrp family transcriptional regulator